jgi:hypothetical protein
MVGAPSESVESVAVRCPFGLEKSPQGLETILARLNLPRGLVPTQLYLSLLAGRAASGPLEKHVKILPMVRDVFGDRPGALVPISIHMQRRASVREDTRTKLSCTWDCDICQLAADERVRADMQTLRNIIGCQ